MSPAHLAAIAPPKTPRPSGDFDVWASQAFELHAAAHGQPPSWFAGMRARGALAIDVPRTLAAPPRGPLLATAVVEQGTGTGSASCPAPTGKDAD